MVAENPKKSYVITKKIAKHGSQAIIVVPRLLEEHLKPGTVVQLNIEVIQENLIKEERK
jgi:hypothetical protein